ncbi:MAG: cell wall metabolism sensor histidine kinase WalK [Clostridia bacterium]|nr:cell wall metabolism sensor histidine kinase WalK [Clostridia bacterium]
MSIISVKQSLLTGEHPSATEKDFNAHADDFASKLSRESAGTRVLLFSTSKALLADSGSGEESLQKEFPELNEVIKGNRTYVARQHEGIRHLYFAFPVMPSGKVIGEVMFVYPMREMDNSTRTIQVLFLISFAAGIAIVLIVSILLTYRITKPILSLKESAVEIAKGNFKNKIRIPSSDEVGDLAKTFNTMSSEIENRIDIINIEKSKLNSVLESMGEGVIALDGSNQIIAINNTAKKAVNNEIESEIRKIAEKVRQSKSRTVVEVNSSEKNILICATPLVLDHDQDGIVFILNDITELRLLQEKQRQFFTNVSHELKTPLTTILGYIDLLKNKGIDKAVFQTSVNYLEDAGDRLLRLVNDLIDLSCLNKYEFEIEPKSTDLSALINEIAGQMSLKAQKFNIKITTSLPQLPEVLVDPARIKQAVVNILDNAIKYSSGGKILISLTQSHTQATLTVEDNGCGIPPDTLDKIFEPFYRIDKARSRNLGGNGLGLAITKEIVEKHGGTITIQSTEGKGTKVSIMLPI